MKALTNYKLTNNSQVTRVCNSLNFNVRIPSEDNKSWITIRVSIVFF